MKHKKTISVLVISIAIIALVASCYGVFSRGGRGSYEIKSFYGEIVPIYGKGLYKNDSVSVAAQGIAQDIVTIIVGVPLLISSLYLSRKGLLKGKLLLAGTLGYFLYTYTSYCFVWMYNSLFLIYVILMSASFFAFLLTMMSFDMESLKISFSEKLPVRLLGFFFIFLGIAIGLMWLGRIVPPLLSGSVPASIEHYTTLPIQALDLGFIVPTAIISGVLTIKRETFGYLLSSVITVKCITMLTAITAMIIGQSLAGVKISFAEIIIFPAANLMVIYLLILILKNVKETKYNMA